MAGHINIVKLSVGSASVESLARWQKRRVAQAGDGLPRHVTRMWPKREDELIAGGSIYWVIKGVVLCRQRIVRLEGVVRDDGVRRCGIVLDPALLPTAAQPRKPFQGWRYLPQTDAPRDLPKDAGTERALPPNLAAALSEIGVR